MLCSISLWLIFHVIVCASLSPTPLLPLPSPSPPQGCGHPALSSLPRSRTFRLWLRHQYFHPHDLLSSLVQHILLTLFVLFFFSLKQHLHVNTLMPFSAHLFFFEGFMVECRPQAPATAFCTTELCEFFFNRSSLSGPLPEGGR